MDEELIDRTIEHYANRSALTTEEGHAAFNALRALMERSIVHPLAAIQILAELADVGMLKPARPIGWKPDVVTLAELRSRIGESLAEITPSPWISDDDHSQIISDATCELVAQAVPCAADADLIAAAPLLLAECAAALDQLLDPTKGASNG